MMKTLRHLTACAIGALAISSLVFAKDGPEPTAPAAVPAPPPTVVSAPATITPGPPAPTTVAVATQPVPDEPIEIGYIEADIQNVLRTLSAKAGINSSSVTR